MKFIDNIKLRFALMPSSKRKTIIYSVVGVIFAVIMLFGYQAREAGSNREAEQEERRRRSFDLPSPDMAKDSWVERGQRLLQQQDRKIEEINMSIRQLRDQMGRMQRGQVPGGSLDSTMSGSAAEREQQLMLDLKRMGVSTVERGGELYPPSPVSPAVPAETATPLPGQTGTALPMDNKPPAEQRQPTATQSPAQQKGQPPQPVVPQESPSTVMGVYTFSDASKSGVTPVAAASGEDELDLENFYTPTGSFFKVNLLSGVDAPAGPTSSSMPHPVLLRVQDLSFLPNEVRQNVTGCFVLAEAYGDLSTERAYLRGINLACVNKENRYVLDEQVQGFVSDSDGKIGLRGNVVSKRGQYLARALFATFIQAVGEGFENAGSTTVVTTGGNVTASDSSNFKDGFKSGFGGGLNETAEKLGDFYLQNAERLYPIIEIGATRNATFTISSGKRFTFDKMIIEGENAKGKTVDGQL